MSLRRRAVYPLLLGLPLLPGCSSSRAIVFASAPDRLTDTTTIDVFAIQPDGSRLRQLTHGQGKRRWSSFPVSSPDGRQIAFIVVPTNYPRDRTQIHIMDKSGRRDRVLVRFDSADASTPEWSPDGTRLLLTQYPDPNGPPGAIYTVKPDGSELTKVPFEPGSYGPPRWEPDGRSFLTSGKLQSGRSVVLRVTIATGQPAVVLTSDSLTLALPQTSPDGSAIVMQGVLEGPPLSAHVFVANADGTHLRRVTPDSGMQNFPRWAHDGRSIVMQCTSAGRNAAHAGLTQLRWMDTFEVCTVTRDGKRFRQVTDNSHVDVHPSW
jgi:Tol biopolymer transport system component